MYSHYHADHFLGQDLVSTLRNIGLNLLPTSMKNEINKHLSWNKIHRRANWGTANNLPAFHTANRNNAYRLFLIVEKQILETPQNHA